MKWYIAQYAPTADAMADWRASPLLAPWVHGVAPAVIIAAELDPLVDEGAAYARRLQGARVPVEYQVHDGMIHGFLTMGGKVDAANDAVGRIASAPQRDLLFKLRPQFRESTLRLFDLAPQRRQL